MTKQEFSAPGKPLTDADRGRELIKHPGAVYQGYLANLASTLGAKTYFEIGTFSGDSLSRIECASIAVDPGFRVKQDIIGKKPLCMLFQMPSDDFFAAHSPSKLHGRPIDVAFLDGMHLFEFLLRDFMNTEKHCTNSSLIVMHDCVPPTFEMAGRTARGATLHPNYVNYWTGDVWKILPILKAYRPDLTIAVLDCPPTGLVVVGNLDPSSRVLDDKYQQIIAEFDDNGHDYEKLVAFYRGVQMVNTHQVKDAKGILQRLQA